MAHYTRHKAKQTMGKFLMYLVFVLFVYIFCEEFNGGGFTENKMGWVFFHFCRLYLFLYVNVWGKKNVSTDRKRSMMLVVNIMTCFFFCLSCFYFHHEDSLVFCLLVPCSLNKLKNY